MNSTEIKSKENIAEDLIRLINNMEEELESFKESLEILRDEELMKSVKTSEEDVKAGRTGVIKDKKDIAKLFAE